jgi:hypothetical protein
LHRRRRPDHELLARVAETGALVEHAELLEDRRGIALQGDPGAEGGDLRLDLDQVDGDAGVGQQSGGRRAGEAGRR